MSSWFDWFGGLISPGATFFYTSANAEGLSYGDRQFRIRAIQLSAVTTSPNGGCIQANVYSPFAAEPVFGTGPVLVGQMPLRRTLRVPNSVWFESGLNAATKLVSIQAIRQWDGDADKIRMLVKVHFQVGPERFQGPAAARLSLLNDAAVTDLGDSFENLVLEPGLGAGGDGERPPSGAVTASGSRRRADARRQPVSPLAAADEPPAACGTPTN